MSMIINAYAIPGLKKELMPSLYRGITSNEVINAVSQHFFMEPSELSIKRRTRGIVYARQLAIYLIKENTALSLAEISKLFGDSINDHTTVIHSINKISELLFSSAKTRYDLESIKNILTPRIYEAHFSNNA